MGRKALELTGKKFGRLMVIERSHKGKHGEINWLCLCDCGNHTKVRAANLINETTKSCGCYHKEKVSTHNMTGVPTFKSWESMKQRCTNQNSPDYFKYGGRGITICDRWLNSFDSFYEDMGLRPKGTTLDRIDNDGNYEPDNCRWATAIEQLSNRRNTARYMFGDSLKTARELSEISGMKIKTIRDRLYAGWSVEKAMFTPNRKAKLN